MKTKIDKDRAKKMMEETASKTVKYTFHVVKIIFILIIIYSVFITVWVYFRSNPEDFLTNIATISVGGFWAFFLGYFGWRMGQNIEEYFTRFKKKK